MELVLESYDLWLHHDWCSTARYGLGGDFTACTTRTRSKSSCGIVLMPVFVPLFSSIAPHKWSTTSSIVRGICEHLSSLYNRVSLMKRVSLEAMMGVLMMHEHINKLQALQQEVLQVGKEVSLWRTRPSHCSLICLPSIQPFILCWLEVVKAKRQVHCLQLGDAWHWCFFIFEQGGHHERYSRMDSRQLYFLPHNPFLRFATGSHKTSKWYLYR